MTCQRPLSRRYVMKGATLYDGTGRRVEDSTVVVDGSRIEDVSAGGEVAAESAWFDLSGLTLMPGLIDCHVHILSYSGPGPVHPSWAYTTFPEEQVLHASANARTALHCGVTSLRDMASGRGEVSLANALKSHVVPGPRLLTSGFVGMTAGHGDQFFPAALPQRPWQTADGADACRKLVREYARMGADWIKICTSGGVLSTGDEPGWRNYTDEEAAVIVDEAHALGKRVAAHAHSRSGIAQALRAGVDSIEHGSELDEPLVEAMLERGTHLVPTLTIGQFLEAEGESRGVPESSMRKSREVHARQAERILTAHKAGVPLVTGTDSCMTMPFGRHAWELAYLVEIIGMKPADALVAATGLAAKAMGIGGEVGTLERGKIADFLVVDGDPVTDIRILQDSERILGVFRDGLLLVDRGATSRYHKAQAG